METIYEVKSITRFANGMGGAMHETEYYISDKKDYKADITEQIKDNKGGLGKVEIVGDIFICGSRALDFNGIDKDYIQKTISV